MAQVLKEEIEKRIYQAAVEEFYLKGYQSATLRDIAAVAGVAVGLIYTYFENKESLFHAVVSPTYLEIKKMLEKPELSSSRPVYSRLLHEDLAFILRLLKTNRRQFIILIDKSHGTIYENAREEIIRLTEIHIRSQLHNELTCRAGEVDDLFYHILANNFMEGLYEIARHYKSEEWAIRNMQLFTQQYVYGINSLVK